MEIIQETIDSIAFTLLPIPGSAFFMGKENDLAARNIHKVQISDSYMAENQVTVFGQSGQQVFQTTLTAAYELDMNDFPAGMYFVKMESQQGISYEKLVVK